jgi:hypothetical protein
MVTNEQIRRARPSVDSPLGRLIKGEINQKEYERQVEEKRAREENVGDEAPSTKQVADSR